MCFVSVCHVHVLQYTDCLMSLHVFSTDTKMCVDVDLKSKQVCVLNCPSLTFLKNINCTLFVALKEYFNKLANTHIRSPAVHLVYMVL